MKASIIAIPKFNLVLNETLVNVLIKLSESHYDSTCKSASKQGGFLFGWRNQIEFREGKVSSDSYNLNLSLKIAEDFMSTLPENEAQIIEDYRSFIMRLFKESEQLSEYKISVEA
jgi:hypothetical protein